MAEKLKTLNAILKHYGVKGMRWGVRGGKSTGSLKTGRSAAKRLGKKVVQIVKKSQKKKKRIKDMTNEELQTKLTRLDLEVRYKAATKRKFSKTEIAIGKYLGNLVTSEVKRRAPGIIKSLIERKMAAMNAAR